MNSRLTQHLCRLGRSLTLALFACCHSIPSSAVNLADAPLFSTVVVPGNLALALSVEWPTATTPAYTTAYSASSTYLGYFDPLKCYQYNYVSTTPSDSYFSPYSYDATGTHTCTSSATLQLWSGNFLNWVSMQTLDTFRWVLTGGYRSTDTTTNTILRKTYAGYDSTVMPDKRLSNATTLTGATPLNWTTWNSRERNLGWAMYFTNSGTWPTTTTSGYTDYNGQNTFVSSTITTGSGSHTTTTSNPAYANPATVYRIFINVQVCKSSVQLESNCIAYGSNHKPEGLMQQYSSKLRYSAFGYLNQTGNRDGGVLRAPMKFIGPTQPVPGSNAIANSNSEWDPSTGVMINNPDPANATATVSAAAAAGYTVTINNSGVMNYLNKFGYTDMTYKGNDPVGELYYAVTRYFRNLGNVSSYSSLSGAGSSATASFWLDGFPAMQTWTDPILYSCQQNFILGIGDVNTWWDGNLPGSTLHSSSEPSVPTEVSTDTTVDVTRATNMVGILEGKTGNTTLGNSWIDSSRGDTYGMSGLAYAAHTTDIRSDLPGMQSIATFWLDVHEGQAYQHKNQYWLAAKYGGFTVPTGFSPYAGTNSTTTIPTTSWYTSTDTVPFSGTTYTNGSGITYTTDTAGNIDPRPDNYFPGNSPQTMQAGLISAFSQIAALASAQTTTGFSVSDPVQASSGNANYVVSYNPNNWTSALTGQLISYDTAGLASFTQVWDATALLDTRTTTNRMIVTCCTVAGAGLPFTNASLTGSSVISRTDYASFGLVAGVPSGSQSVQDYVNYLRGDRSNELTSSGGKYRARTHLLGDIVNGKLTPVPAPQADYYDTYNSGYSTFAANYGNRPTIVYAPANDGMLHAFDGTVPNSTTATCTSTLTNPTTACGKEVFAYIPSFVYGDNTTGPISGLASLGTPSSFSHHFLVDATPVAADVDFYKTPSPAATTNDWRSILVGGLGKGGQGFYALDITNPAGWSSESVVASKVLWEFTQSTMGYSYGNAVIVKTPEYGWTVIVASGYNNSNGVGYIYFINPRTGSLLRTVATPTGSTVSPINLAYLRAYIPNTASYLADSIYAGDMQGNVWRLDLTATNTTVTTGSTTSTTNSYNYGLVKIAQLTDAAGNPQPVTTRPVVAADPNSGKRYVLIGTGRLLADTDTTNTQTQTFYAIVDGNGNYGQFYNSNTSSTVSGTTTTNSGLPYPTSVIPPVSRSDLVSNSNLLTGISSAATQQMGWYLDLSASTSGITEQINVDPVASNGIVAFAANLPNGDACSPSGTAREFAVSFADGITVLTSNGAAAAYIDATSSIISLTSISKSTGQAVNFGQSTGGNNQQSTPSKPVYRKLNWREVPTVD